MGWLAVAACACTVVFGAAAFTTPAGRGSGLLDLCFVLSAGLFVLAMAVILGRGASIHLKRHAENKRQAGESDRSRRA